MTTSNGEVARRAESQRWLEAFLKLVAAEDIESTEAKAAIISTAAGLAHLASKAEGDLFEFTPRQLIELTGYPGALAPFLPRALDRLAVMGWMNEWPVPALDQPRKVRLTVSPRADRGNENG